MVINFTTCSVIILVSLADTSKHSKLQIQFTYCQYCKKGLQDFRSNCPEIILKTAVQKIRNSAQKLSREKSVSELRFSKFEVLYSEIEHQPYRHRT